jgi:hypothetical protein
VPPLPVSKAGATPQYGLSPGQWTFAQRVAQKTGLRVDVVAAWITAEGVRESAHNPLGVMRDGNLREFGSWTQAADFVANLINRSDNYRGIRAAARGDDAGTQIAAIAASPWDANHYRGNTSEVGVLLRGTWERIAGDGGIDLPDVLPDIPSAGDVADAVTEPIVEAAAGVQAWVQEKAALALAYVLLTGLSGALFVLGVRGLLYSGDHMAGQAFDRRVRELAPSGGSRGSGGDDDIPF